MIYSQMISNHWELYWLPGTLSDCLKYTRYMGFWESWYYAAMYWHSHPALITFIFIINFIIMCVKSVYVNYIQEFNLSTVSEVLHSSPHLLSIDYSLILRYAVKLKCALLECLLYKERQRREIEEALLRMCHIFEM